MNRLARMALVLIPALAQCQDLTLQGYLKDLSG